MAIKIKNSIGGSVEWRGYLAAEIVNSQSPLCVHTKLIRALRLKNPLLATIAIVQCNAAQPTAVGVNYKVAIYYIQTIDN